jgi:hypothetical protein
MPKSTADISLEAMITYKAGEACYRIGREKPGVYSAVLVYYEGDKNDLPPDSITLVRGVRQWTGSHTDEVLLMQLGSRIEQVLGAQADL